MSDENPEANRSQESIEEKARAALELIKRV
jgi:hypothetical protein